jgi:hypothetical protein
MVIAVRTERGPNGLEVVKEAHTDEDRARLGHEAEMLGRAQHPGVVEVTSSTPSVLRLRHRGTALSRIGALPPDHVAAMVRSVAEVVDDLHRLGIAHTRIEADHVVVGDRGRPRLCGFAEATDATDDLRAGDVAALGELLDRLLDGSGDAQWSPVHRGVRQAARRRRALSGFRLAATAARREEPGQRPSARQFASSLHDALPDLALPAGGPAGSASEFAAIPADVDPTADIAWTDDDLSYLTAEEDDDHGDPFARLAALTESSGGAATSLGGAGHSDRDDPAGADLAESDLGEPPPEAAVDEPPAGRTDPLAPIRIREAPAGRSSQPARSRRALLVVIALLVAAAGAVAGALLAREIQPFGSEGAAPAEPSPGTMTVAGGAPAVSTPGPEPIPPALPQGCSPPDVPGPDLDGDGCPEPVELRGRSATVGGIEVELGRDGDLAVVADHDCDGVATPVVLRPASGELFFFDRWNLDEPVEVRAGTVVPGASSIRTDSGSCPSVLVTSDDGTDHVVAGPVA